MDVCKEREPAVNVDEGVVVRLEDVPELRRREILEQEQRLQGQVVVRVLDEEKSH